MGEGDEDMAYLTSGESTSPLATGGERVTSFPMTMQKNALTERGFELQCRSEGPRPDIGAPFLGS